MELRFSIPRLTALDLEFALTIPCARLRRLDSGCEGIVWASKVTAKARRTGARFVRMDLLARSERGRLDSGRSEAGLL